MGQLRLSLTYRSKWCCVVCDVCHCVSMIVYTLSVCYQTWSQFLFECRTLLVPSFHCSYLTPYRQAAAIILL